MKRNALYLSVIVVTLIVLIVGVYGQVTMPIGVENNATGGVALWDSTVGDLKASVVMVTANGADAPVSFWMWNRFGDSTMTRITPLNPRLYRTMSTQLALGDTNVSIPDGAQWTFKFIDPKPDLVYIGSDAGHRVLWE